MVNDITQAVVNKNTEGTVANAGLDTHPGDALPMARNVITARKRDISPNVAIQELVQSSQRKSRKELHDMEQEPQGQYFEFEQDSVQIIKFGNNLKGFKGNQNVLFDKIDGPQHILTDLSVQGASNYRDCNPVSSKYQGPVLKCRFKVDSGAADNIIPYNIFQELYPNMPKSALKNSINKTTHLVAYNKKEIKQLGTCILKVNYGGKTLACEFFVVSSKFKPIIGLDASRNLGLLTVNCPIYQSWTKDAAIDAVSSTD